MSMSVVCVDTAPASVCRCEAGCAEKQTHQALFGKHLTAFEMGVMGSAEFEKVCRSIITTSAIQAWFSEACPQERISAAWRAEQKRVADRKEHERRMVKEAEETAQLLVQAREQYDKAIVNWVCTPADIDIAAAAAVAKQKTQVRLDAQTQAITAAVQLAYARALCEAEIQAWYESQIEQAKAVDGAFDVKGPVVFTGTTREERLQQARAFGVKTLRGRAAVGRVLRESRKTKTFQADSEAMGFSDPHAAEGAEFLADLEEKYPHLVPTIAHYNIKFNFSWLSDVRLRKHIEAEMERLGQPKYFTAPAKDSDLLAIGVPRGGGSGSGVGTTRELELAQAPPPAKIPHTETTGVFSLSVFVLIIQPSCCTVL